MEIERWNVIDVDHGRVGIFYFYDSPYWINDVIFLKSTLVSKLAKTLQKYKARYFYKVFHIKL